MPMKRDDLIEYLNKKYPEIDADYSEDFGVSGGGIWLKGTEDMCWDSEILAFQTDATLNEVNDFLSENGWFIEPYDHGTFMIWKA